VEASGVGGGSWGNVERRTFNVQLFNGGGVAGAAIEKLDVER